MDFGELWKQNHSNHRLFVLLEFPWSAEQAIQQFGRVNRTNQRYYPQYVIATSDVPGERRFASSIAYKVKRLGALTQGTQKVIHTMKLHQFDYCNGAGMQAVSLTIKKAMQIPRLRSSLSSVGIKGDTKIEIRRFFNRWVTKYEYDVICAEAV